MTRVELVAVRHGESEANAAGRFTGQLDPPLTARGRAQAAALAGLVDAGVDLGMHSGLRRAAATLRIACAAAGRGDVPSVAEPRWRERALGVLEGTPIAGAVVPAPDVDAAPPGGESYRALGLRVHAALADLGARAAAAQRPLRVIVATHSGVLRILRAYAEGAPSFAAVHDRPPPAHGEAVTLSYATLALPAFLRR
jgi:broad specificity phosphatase PhoE